MTPNDLTIFFFNCNVHCSLSFFLSARPRPGRQATSVTVQSWPLSGQWQSDRTVLPGRLQASNSPALRLIRRKPGARCEVPGRVMTRRRCKFAELKFETIPYSERKLVVMFKCVGRINAFVKAAPGLAAPLLALEPRTAEDAAAPATWAGRLGGADAERSRRRLSGWPVPGGSEAGWGGPGLECRVIRRGAGPAPGRRGRAGRAERSGPG